MPKLRAWAAAPEFAIHADWMEGWLPDLKSPASRKAIWNGTRFADRIRAALLGGSDADAVPAAVPAQADLIEALVRASVTPGWTRRIGLHWVAPNLASRLLGARARETLGGFAKPEIERVLRARDHAPADVVGPVGGDTDIAREGELCVLAWLGGLDEAVAPRVGLLLPRLIPAPSPDPDARRSARIALMTRYLGDGFGEDRR